MLPNWDDISSVEDNRVQHVRSNTPSPKSQAYLSPSSSNRKPPAGKDMTKGGSDNYQQHSSFLSPSMAEAFASPYNTKSIYQRVISDDNKGKENSPLLSRQFQFETQGITMRPRSPTRVNFEKSDPIIEKLLSTPLILPNKASTSSNPLNDSKQSSQIPLTHYSQFNPTPSSPRHTPPDKPQYSYYDSNTSSSSMINQTSSSSSSRPFNTSNTSTSYSNNNAPNTANPTPNHTTDMHAHTGTLEEKSILLNTMELCTKLQQFLYNLSHHIEQETDVDQKTILALLTPYQLQHSYPPKAGIKIKPLTLLHAHSAGAEGGGKRTNHHLITQLPTYMQHLQELLFTCLQQVEDCYATRKTVYYQQIQQIQHQNNQAIRNAIVLDRQNAKDHITSLHQQYQQQLQSWKEKFDALIAAHEQSMATLTTDRDDVSKELAHYQELNGRRLELQEKAVQAALQQQEKFYEQELSHSKETMNMELKHMKDSYEQQIGLLKQQHQKEKEEWKRQKEFDVDVLIEDKLKQTHLYHEAQQMIQQVKQQMHEQQQQFRQEKERLHHDYEEQMQQEVSNHLMTQSSLQTQLSSLQSKISQKMLVPSKSSAEVEHSLQDLRNSLLQTHIQHIEKLNEEHEGEIHTLQKEKVQQVAEMKKHFEFVHRQELSRVIRENERYATMLKKYNLLASNTPSAGIGEGGLSLSPNTANYITTPIRPITTTSSTARNLPKDLPSSSTSSANPPPNNLSMTMPVVITQLTPTRNRVAFKAHNTTAFQTTHTMSGPRNSAKEVVEVDEEEDEESVPPPPPPAPVGQSVIPSIQRMKTVSNKGSSTMSTASSSTNSFRVEEMDLHSFPNTNPKINTKTPNTNTKVLPRFDPEHLPPSSFILDEALATVKEQKNKNKADSTTTTTSTTTNSAAGASHTMGGWGISGNSVRVSSYLQELEEYLEGSEPRESNVLTEILSPFHPRNTNTNTKIPPITTTNTITTTTTTRPIPVAPTPTYLSSPSSSTGSGGGGSDTTNSIYDSLDLTAIASLPTTTATHATRGGLVDTGNTSHTSHTSSSTGITGGGNPSRMFDHSDFSPESADTGNSGGNGSSSDGSGSGTGDADWLFYGTPDEEEDREVGDRGEGGARHAIGFRLPVSSVTPPRTSSRR